MNYKIIKKPSMKFIGFQREFSMDNSYAEIPKFWDEIMSKYAKAVTPVNEHEKTVIDNRVGEFGLCIDDIGGENFRYMIAGIYTKGSVPDGMVLYEFPEGEWAVFDCTGRLPDALQSLNTRIFSEWLPGNAEYELLCNASIEWYDCKGKTTDADYHSAIWLPVKCKNK